MRLVILALAALSCFAQMLPFPGPVAPVGGSPSNPITVDGCVPAADDGYTTGNSYASGAQTLVAGHDVIIACGTEGSALAGGSASVTDLSGGANTFVHIAGGDIDAGSLAPGIQLFYLANAPAGVANNTYTCTWSNAVTGRSVAGLQFHNTTAPVLDGVVTPGYVSSGGGATATSGSFNTTGTKGLVVAAAMTSTAGSWTAGTIGGISASLPAGCISTYNFLALEYANTTSALTGATASISRGTSNPQWSITGASFK